MGNEKPTLAQLGYKSRVHFVLMLLVNIAVFAVSLATFITLVFFGWRILLHGVPMCKVLAENDMLDRMLYTSCGCALVEIVLIPLSAFGTYISAPRMFKQLLWLRSCQ